MKAQSQAPTRKTKAAVDSRQNNKMLRQCPLGIAQQRVYHAVTVATAVRNRVTKTMSAVTAARSFRLRRGPRRDTNGRVHLSFAHFTSSHCSSAASSSFCRHVPSRSHICVIIVRHRSCSPDPHPLLLSLPFPPFSALFGTIW